MHPRLLVVAILSLGQALAGAPKPAPIDTYAIHADGGLIYDPLRREAEKSGQLSKFDNTPTSKVRIENNGVTFEAAVPKSATAYDVVPIRYTLRSTQAAGTPPVHVAATAFEDAAKVDRRALFDLSLPGRIAVDFKYLGSVTAKYRPGGKHQLTPDLSDLPAERFPNFDASPMVRSGSVEAGDIVWFQFEFTNTGDTILDSEGIGGFLFEPKLLRQAPDGSWKPFGIPYNRYIRIFKTIYPGESGKIWMNFMSGEGEIPTHGFGLAPGRYKIELNSMARYESQFDWIVNIWSGRVVQQDEWEFEVAGHPAARDPGPMTRVVSDGPDRRKLNEGLHTFEEFMTAFDGHLQGVGKEGVTGTLHLQVAPWTKMVTLKLLVGNPPALQTVAVPVTVESDSLEVTFKTTDRNLIWSGDLWKPLIATQTMSDMRANIQMGPDVEQTLRKDLAAMKNHGITMVTTTAMPWLYDFIERPYVHAQPTPESNPNGDALKYFLDLARLDGPQIEGWINYPYPRSTIGEIASWVTGKPFDLTEVFPGEADLLDPDLVRANAAVTRYQFQRWGDNFALNAGGEIPFSVEDTRGWLRLDVHSRFPKGPTVLAAFRDWSKARFGSLENLNAAWGTRFKNWDEIDPERGQEINQFGHKWVYSDDRNPFHDWSAAILEWDAFRTELRVRNYRDLLAMLRPTLPGATINVRTEGGNALVAGIDPADSNPHFRHVYYSQRRCGLIAEILQPSKTVAYHSDYTTMPYTPTEVRELTRRAVAQGVTPMWFAQFNHMRDTAMNDRYGSGDYQRAYNVDTPVKGAMMHVLTPVFPWWKAVAEEGGVPAILWQDYECDGFVTETQLKEITFFQEKLRLALDRPEIASQINTRPKPDQTWRKQSKALQSYRNAGPAPLSK